MAKVSLKSQIAAVDAVVSGQFPIVASSASQRQLIKEQLGAVIETLRWLQTNEPAVRAFVESRKGVQR
ncbi:hypothetical protein RvVAT039_04630 [Agrobacterium vitis]|uniref:hypothetical protein n=1 Tax=Rhizobium/Agrobacterium group TaxID=227290 RepID=UPI0012E70BA1|nr:MULTISPECIES: hypothetical protein [Rhizobium/Agrobacterium group]MCF1485050.1 hypothetical protein [Allorhizobium ampelinum]MCF1492466.1 hypothetical protein [Allorhizobium ampelinum]MVA44456.1 hypothetical protein [Agrobacterium vitis]BCH63247.1 hypothetical protein RvVAT039_04630 [Agrobacterium vitis]